MELLLIVVAALLAIIFVEVTAISVVVAMRIAHNFSYKTRIGQ